MINSSVEAWYAPEIPPLLMLPMIRRFSYSLGFWVATYRDLYDDLDTDVTAENVSIAGINLELETLDPGGTDGRFVVNVPMQDQQARCDFWGIDPNAVLEITSPVPPVGFDNLNAMCSGLALWNAYKLTLALQAKKVDRFGVRGHP